MQRSVDKHFVSNIDKFLAELREILPESPSQQREREKHARIATLRDQPQPIEEQATLWEEF